MNFGQYIKKLRSDNGLSQRDLSAVSGISNAEISRIETGERKNPSYLVLKAISPHLNIPYEKLLQKAGYIDSLEESERFADPNLEVDIEKADNFLRRAASVYEKDEELVKLACKILESGLSEAELEIFKILNTTLLEQFLKNKGNR
jgi:HTH-type transcriptional regulator, competence development regulator